MRFIGLGLLDEMEVALHVVVASADTRHGVAGLADSEIRRMGGRIDWEDLRLVDRTYALFLGTLVLKDRPQPRPELKRVPANTRLRMKLLPHLLKSREAAARFPACIQVHDYFLTKARNHTVSF